MKDLLDEGILVEVLEGDGDIIMLQFILKQI